MSNRINKSQALQIANALLELKMLPECRAKIAAILADTDRRLTNYVPNEVKEFAEKFPNFLRRTSYHYVRNSLGHRTGVKSAEQLISLPATANDDFGYYQVTDEDFTAFDENMKQIKELESNLHQVRGDIVNKIKGKGVEGVCKTWPEACSIVRELMGEKIQLPAVQNSELNKLLGLPVEN